jgi:WD40 repeat protein
MAGCIVWDRAGRPWYGTHLRAIVAHGDWNPSLRGYRASTSIRPDGRLLAPGRDGVTAWNLQKPAPGETCRIPSFYPDAYSPDGRMAVNLHKGVVSLADLADGSVRSVTVTTGRAPEPHEARFIADGRVVVVCQNETTVSLRDPASGDVIATTTSPPNVSRHVQLSGDGRWLCDATRDRFEVTDLTARVPARRVPMPPGSEAYQIAISRSGKAAVAGGFSGWCAIDVEAGRAWTIDTRDPGSRRVAAVAISPDAAHGAIAYEDQGVDAPGRATVVASGVVELWALMRPERLATIEGRGVNELAFSADGATLFAVGEGVTAVDVARRRERDFPRPYAGLRACAFTADGRIITLDADSRIEVRDGASGKVSKAVVTGLREPDGMTVSTDGRHAYVRPMVGEPVCFDVERGVRVAPPPGLAAPVLRQFHCTPSCISSDGRVVEGDGDGDVPGAAPAAVRLRESFDDAAISPDGRWIAAVNDIGDVSLLADGGTRVLARWTAPDSGRFRCSSPASVAWSPRGDRLAVGTLEGRLLLFEIVQGWARTRER